MTPRFVSRLAYATSLAVILLPALPAQAADEVGAAQEVLLADGGMLYVFKDGKMAKADRLGRVARMKVGQVVETRDGRTIAVTSNESARLGYLLQQGHRGGR